MLEMIPIAMSTFRNFNRRVSGKSIAKKALYKGARQYKLKYSSLTTVFHEREVEKKRKQSFSPLVTWRKKKLAQINEKRSMAFSDFRYKKRTR